MKHLKEITIVHYRRRRVTRNPAAQSKDVARDGRRDGKKRLGAIRGDVDDRHEDLPAGAISIPPDTRAE